MTPNPAGLDGRRILVVEDEYFIALDLAETLRAAGAETVGPAATIESALTLIGATADLSAAVLDINLRGEMGFPVADALLARRVPFVFATGYDGEMIPPRFAHIPRYEKPIAASAVVRELLG